jgi:hypothetical protein
MRRRAALPPSTAAHRHFPFAAAAPSCSASSTDDGWKPFWLDTVTVAARDTARIAFLADNPGKWLIRSQAIDRAGTAASVWFEVA